MTAAEPPPIAVVRLATFGLPESSANEQLADIQERYRVTVGYRVHFPELEIEVLSCGDTEQEATDRAHAAAQEIRARLGREVVLGEAPLSLPESVVQLLRSRHLTLGLAESCTGGLLSVLLTDAAGASHIFQGSAVTYANDAKTRILGVSQTLLEQHGAVSPQVAQAMAEGALRVFQSSVALSITGIAGPTGGTQQKPVGLVYAGLAFTGRCATRELRLHGSRAQIRRLAAFTTFGWLRRTLLEDPTLTGA